MDVQGNTWIFPLKSEKQGRQGSSRKGKFLENNRDHKAGGSSLSHVMHPEANFQLGQLRRPFSWVTLKRFSTAVAACCRTGPAYLCAVKKAIQS